MDLKTNATDMQQHLLSADRILEMVEKRYAGSGFKASFFQESTIKAIDIKDYAFGKIWVKYPGMMRWEYEKPDRQIIITDGNNLWFYRPEDNQVMLGKFPAFFSKGKGAGFLADLQIIRQKFNINLEKNNNAGFYELKLIPKEKTFDFEVLYLSISKDRFDIVNIVSRNSYGDETRIELNEFGFNENLDESMFKFKIPEGTEILMLEE